MSTQIFVNLPMKDLERSRVLFTALGYSFNPQFSDENAGCLVISDDIYAMLLVEPYFKTFIKKKLADATKSTETIIALSADSPAEVDKLSPPARLSPENRRTRASCMGAASRTPTVTSGRSSGWTPPRSRGRPITKS